ncbi:cell division topological specificity factor MinE [Helicobacter ailurogastricus]|uniref:Cell division topological specificity factor n=1 Tax=Helicobacter ailurogastricus TaxID=1578720 RepID=A0A0K2X9W4_9HELI|nr:cell division topological specificity factor MinE [Helicobacter ailurogastricus]CRF41754.1 Cell division topological specificity factor MinE [Helicobacter ailurogastricus]CRF42096.1 Cell division topological specificity factor MinE [Helicobacter ailurogastricus]CRF44165.1 Cell division topological specificity factor MinE [Helicobacter ailurogastricus]CRF52935.1 Cell division topological specificity factor MinE [Helicobacter ailurogastricus]BDQ28398.1 cell division topological specificity fa
MTSLLGKWLKGTSSAHIAKDRLKLVLAYERSVRLPYIEEMKKEILAVVQKYTQTSKIDVRTNSNHDIDTLEVEIVLEKQAPTS